MPNVPSKSHYLAEANNFRYVNWHPEVQCLTFHQSHMVWQKKIKRFFTEWKWLETSLF